MKFQKAKRILSKLRLAISGPSGAGKTFGALLIAKGMGGRIAVIDTERGSASLYDHLVDFDVLELGPPFTPERYVEAVTLAERERYDIVIIDSITHEWAGEGGCLEINEVYAQTKCKGNTWSAWKHTDPRHRKLVDKILQSPCHIICTMRSKTETVQGDDKRVKKLGMKSIQRDGMDYEFTLQFDIDHETHLAVATKNRTPMFKDDPHVISEQTGRLIVEWLSTGQAQAVEQDAKRRAEQASAEVLAAAAAADDAEGEGEIDAPADPDEGHAEGGLSVQHRLLAALDETGWTVEVRNRGTTKHSSGRTSDPLALTDEEAARMLAVVEKFLANSK